jgi:hypothetical protein
MCSYGPKQGFMRKKDVLVACLFFCCILSFSNGILEGSKVELKIYNIFKGVTKKQSTTTKSHIKTNNNNNKNNNR